MIEISILLPTRGRTTMLKTSIESMLVNAKDPSRIEFLLAFDDDDASSSSWFIDNVAPTIDEYKSSYTIMEFPRLGYIRLNEYVNALAAEAHGNWLFFWGDDGIIESRDWDERIVEVTDFKVLRIPTHNNHPYAIWPIIPKDWYRLFGYISAHQLSDSWVSQVGYLVDIIQNIDVKATHDRFDITGNNKDETFDNRPMLEGNHHSPRDFNYKTWRMHRFRDAEKISQFIKKQGGDTPWWDSVKSGQQDPWEKMMSREYDPNQQLSKFK